MLKTANPKKSSTAKYSTSINDLSNPEAKSVKLLNRTAGSTVIYKKASFESSQIISSNDTPSYIIDYGESEKNISDKIIDCEELNMDDEYIKNKTICITNIFRNLSFVSKNQRVMANSEKFLETCSFVMDTEDVSAEYENILTCLSNIGMFIDFHTMSMKVVKKILDELFVWITFEESSTPHFSRSFDCISFLCLDTVSKICMSGSNVDFLLNYLWEDLMKLCTALENKLFVSKEMYIQEMCIHILYHISEAATRGRKQLPSSKFLISFLVSFIEMAEEGAKKVAIKQGVSTLCKQPSRMGTSLGSLKRAAHMLKNLALQVVNRNIFMTFEQRLVNLLTSSILDKETVNILSETVFTASLEYEAQRTIKSWGWEPKNEASREIEHWNFEW